MKLFRSPPLPAEIVLRDPPARVRLKPHARARRLTLRLDRSGAADAVLTVPTGLALREAEGFLGRHAGWLANALAKQPQPAAVRIGTLLPIDGVPTEIVVSTARGVRLERGVLSVGPGAVGPRVAGWLKLRARDRMVPEVQAHAAVLGRPLTGVSLRDTTSRWGSCSTTGRISLSWRLAMAPVDVQAYLAAHEAAHLAEMNHGPRFWATVERLMPGYRAPQAWLKREGRALHAWRFDG